MVGMVFNQHHVTDIGAAGNGAFQEIVAEHGFRVKALVKNGVNGLDIEQAFAGESAHSENILIQVGRAAAVGVNAALPGKHGMKG